MRSLSAVAAVAGLCAAACGSSRECLDEGIHAETYTNSTDGSVSCESFCVEARRHWSACEVLADTAGACARTGDSLSNPHCCEIYLEDDSADRFCAYR